MRFARKTIKRVYQATICVTAALAIMFCAQVVLVRDTVGHGQAIASSFFTAAQFIDPFITENRRPPSTQEFNEWKGNQPDTVFGVRSMELLAPQYLPPATLQSFGPAPKGAYALIMWRGEWNEYYASWTQSSTVDNPAGIYAFAIIPFVLSVLATLWLWGRLRKQAQRRE